MATVRLLQPGDEEDLESFLASRPDTSMFLRNNWRSGGLADEGDRIQGTYAAAFEGDAVVAVASHINLGNVLVEAPRHLDDVVVAAVRASGRPVSAIVGPQAQVVHARSVLGLDAAAAMLESCEDLFSLELEDLRVPDALVAGQVVCRRAREAEVDLLIEWRIAYDMEALGSEDSPALRERCAAVTRRTLDEGNGYVLEHEGVPVSYSGFNARIPDCVQIGGVWTPPSLRSRGFARAAVAGSLLDVRESGVTRSILFTQQDNHAARACYLGLGYEIVGDYGLVLFREGQEVAV